MQSFWRNPQNIIALGVTLISVCALVVSITQTRVMIRQSELMDRQARASVRPILEIERSRAFDVSTRTITAFSFTVENSGVGPATIDEVFVTFAGQPIRHWGELYEALEPPDTVPDYVDQYGLNHTVLQAGQEKGWLDLSSNPRFASLLNARTDELTFTVLYRSLYDDRYLYTWQGGATSNRAFDPRKDAVVGEEFAN